MEKQIPEFLKTMLIEQYGEEIANKIIDGYSKQRYVTLRANTIKATNEEIKKELKNSNIEYKEIVLPLNLEFRSTDTGREIKL